jgi:hypothetical protein
MFKQTKLGRILYLLCYSKDIVEDESKIIELLEKLTREDLKKLNNPELANVLFKFKLDSLTNPSETFKYFEPIYDSYETEILHLLET